MERLTHSSNLSYPEVRIMEENAEIVEKTQKALEETPEEKKKKAQKKQEEDKKRKEQIEKQYEEHNKARRARGEEVTDEELEQQKKLIESGVPIIAGGAGDGNFENFETERFESNNSLEELARMIKAAGEQSKVDEEFLKQVREQLNRRVQLGLVNEDEGRRFNAYLNSFVINEQNSESQGAESRAETGDEHFENFPAHEFQGTPLEALTNEIVAAGRNTPRSGRVPDPAVNEWGNRARTLHNSGEIDKETYDRFMTALYGISRERQDDERRRTGRVERRERENTPRSIQEVCEWIIDKEGDEWGPDGINALLDHEGKFSQANFVKWARERMLHFHNLDPNNQVNLLGTVGIETEYRTIGLITMINNKKQYFKDKGSSEVYSKLADDLLNEIYLFQTSRNHDATYRFDMWQDEKLPETLQSLHQKSDFTSGDQMENIFSLSADYNQDKENNDTRVGDSIRKAYEIYYNISDFEELQKLLGEDSLFFTRKGFEDALKVSARLDTDASDRDAAVPIPSEYREVFDKIFDENGRAKPQEFIDYINLFNDSSKNQSAVSLVREVVRLTVADKYGLEDGLDDRGNVRDIKRKNLEYAEAWAYSMVRWTGAAARNDTAAIGYDAFAKTQRFRQYRVRQSSAGRGGAFGNEYDVPIIKQLTPDFFNGIFVEKGVGEEEDYTPFEIFQQLDEVDKRTDISEEEKNRLKKPIFQKLRFKQYAQLDYASNQVGRAYKVFHSLMGANELHIDEIVKYEPFRGYVFDRGKFEEQVKENFIKPIRYAFSTYSGIDYSKKIRVQVNAGSRDLPQYKEMTFAEAMFGPQVLQDFYLRDRHGKILRGEDGSPLVDEDKLQKDRALIYKRVVRAILAAHLRSHRELRNGYSKMDYEQVEKFYTALRSIREIDLVDEGEDVSVKRTGSFFTKEDIEWMRKYSGTTKGKMILQDITPTVLGGLGKGTWSGIKDFIDDIFD